MTTLVDQFIPVPDAAERHAIVIDAPREKVWHATAHLDLADIRLVKPLFAARDLVARVRKGDARESLPDFTPLAEDPGKELVHGIIGQWWRLARADNVSSIDGMAGFQAFDRPGYAKATLSFRLDDAGKGRIRLVTETRVVATSPEARRAFLRYWFVIRLGSGLVRRIMLSAIKAQALR